MGHGDMGNGEMGNGEMGNGEMGNGHVDPHHSFFLVFVFGRCRNGLKLWGRR